MKLVKCPTCGNELEMNDCHHWETIWDDAKCYEIWWASCESCKKDFQVNLDAKLAEIQVKIEED